MQMSSAVVNFYSCISFFFGKHFLLFLNLMAPLKYFEQVLEEAAGGC
uniref:Uncharacterized protein n=1 Tax=Arundo donax TaxID=35708 RepID=A0A0A9GPS0_ARUDO